MIDMLENNCVFIAPDLDINKMYALGMTDEEIEEKLNEKAEKNPKNAKFEAADFAPEYITALKADQELLNFLNTEWASVTDADDSKYDKFVNLYEKTCTKLPKVAKLTTKRKTAINKLIKEMSLKEIESAFKIINNSNFCKHATLDLL